MKKYYESLTSLRGIFIIGIVVYHVNTLFNSCFSKIFGFVYEYGGYFGNYYFFIASGFLLNNAYKQKIVEEKMDFFTFIIRRLKKIYPLYFLTNVYMLLYFIYRDGVEAAFHLKDALKIIFLVPWGWFDNVMPYNHPCWFLSILLICYIFYYFIVKYTKGNRKIYGISVAAIILWGCLLMKKDWGGGTA